MGRFGRVLVQDIRYTKHKKDSTPFSRMEGTGRGDG